MNHAKSIRNLLLSVSLAAGAFAAPAYAQISFNINVAPPAPQYEVVPAIAPGQVWAPGYWGWSGDRHVWIRGRPIMQRTGYKWAPDRWEQRNGSYYRTSGHWEHDKGYKPVKVKKEKKQKFSNGHDNSGKNRGKQRGKGKD